LPPKACSSTRALGLIIEALRSPARNLSAPNAALAGSGASLANRMTLRLVRLSFPVVGPAGAVLEAIWGATCGAFWGGLRKTLLRSGPKGFALVAGAGAGSALATLLGGAGLASAGLGAGRRGA